MEKKVLVKRAKRGDTHAFAKLYEEIYKELYRYALYMLRNEKDAEDVVSETVIAAFHSITLLKDESKFEQWMFSILSNQCRIWIRHYYENKISIDDEENCPQEITSKDSYPQEVEDKMYIEDLLNSLKEDEKEIILLHVFGGYRYHEIASILGLNENTVRSKESRAMKKLRENWKEVR